MKGKPKPQSFVFVSLFVSKFVYGHHKHPKYLDLKTYLVCGLHLHILGLNANVIHAP